MIRQLSSALLFVTVLTSLPIAAHHSRAAFFDMSQVVEIEGVITRVQWRHPHVRYWIQADPAYGGQEWETETTPPSLLERYGISPDILTEGTRVRVAGPPSKVADYVMEASHVLLPDGREVLLHVSTPRWTDNTVERILQEFDEDAIRAAEESADGIFRVWSRAQDNTRPSFWSADSYPLTDSARAAQAAWIPVENINTGCAPKGMPRLMGSNWPFEFEDEDDVVVLRAEEFDVVRRIHLDQQMPAIVELTAWGHSVGRWVDGDLIVETRGVNSNFFGAAGITLSDDVEMIEVFSMTDEEQRLDYEITVIDPATFSEPVTLSSFWIWRPGEKVNPYNCIDTPGSWSYR